jgi:hypothetical protein
MHRWRPFYMGANLLPAGRKAAKEKPPSENGRLYQLRSSPAMTMIAKCNGKEIKASLPTGTLLERRADRSELRAEG